MLCDGHMGSRNTKTLGCLSYLSKHIGYVFYGCYVGYYHYSGGISPSARTIYWLP